MSERLLVTSRKNLSETTEAYIEEILSTLKDARDGGYLYVSRSWFTDTLPTNSHSSFYVAESILIAMQEIEVYNVTSETKRPHQVVCLRDKGVIGVSWIHDSLVLHP